MDFGNALYLTAAVFGIVTIAKVVFKVTDPRAVCGIVILSAYGATFLLAATVWANEQVIGNHNLGDLDFWSKIAVGLFLSGAETAVFLGLDAVKNVGQNRE
jgi:hypothetical protein